MKPKPIKPKRTPKRSTSINSMKPPLHRPPKPKQSVEKTSQPPSSLSPTPLHCATPTSLYNPTDLFTSRKRIFTLHGGQMDMDWDDFGSFKGHTPVTDDDENDEEEEEVVDSNPDDEEEQEISDFDEIGTSDEESLTDSGVSLSTDTRGRRTTRSRVLEVKDSAISLTADTPPPPPDVKSPIVPSLFDDGDAVLFFPSQTEQVRPLPKDLTTSMHWKICKFTPKVVRDVLRRTGFKLIKGGRNWVGYWGKHYPSEKFKTVQPWQKINHFPMSFEIGRKDRMYANVSRIRNRLGNDAIDFLPETFLVPQQRRKLRTVFGEDRLWIVKPPASARGLGIKVVAKWSGIPKKKEAVVSRYISNPYLIHGRKFDLRLYVVVTSFEPLRIYLHKEGIVRFAVDPYTSSTNPKDVKNRHAHLTNYSVSKKSKKAAPPLPDAFPIHGCKWSFDTLKSYMTHKSHDYDCMMSRVRGVIVKTLVSANTSNASGVRLCVANSASCYELFGFDVLIDAELKPWLMEVNISPSLKASGEMDFGVKSRMVTDLFNLVGVKIKDLETCKSWWNKRKPPIKPRHGPHPSHRQKHRDYLRTPDFDCLKDLNDDDIRILKETEDEYRRRGHFDRLLPTPTSASYFPYFANVSYYDRLVEQWTRRSRCEPGTALLLGKEGYGLEAVFMEDVGLMQPTSNTVEGKKEKAVGGKPVIQQSWTRPPKRGEEEKKKSWEKTLRTSSTSNGRKPGNLVSRESSASTTSHPQRPSEPSRSSTPHLITTPIALQPPPLHPRSQSSAPLTTPRTTTLSTSLATGSRARENVTPSILNLEPYRPPHSTPRPQLDDPPNAPSHPPHRLPPFPSHRYAAGTLGEAVDAVTRPKSYRFSIDGVEPGQVVAYVGGVARLRSIRNAFATMKRRPVDNGYGRTSSLCFINAAEDGVVGDWEGYTRVEGDGEPTSTPYPDTYPVDDDANVLHHEVHVDVAEDRDVEPPPPLFPSWGTNVLGVSRRKEVVAKKAERAVGAVSRAAERAVVGMVGRGGGGGGGEMGPWVRSVTGVDGRGLLGE